MVALEYAYYIEYSTIRHANFCSLYSNWFYDLMASFVLFTCLYSAYRSICVMKSINEMFLNDMAANLWDNITAEINARVFNMYEQNNC